MKKIITINLTKERVSVTSENMNSLEILGALRCAEKTVWMKMNGKPVKGGKK